MRLSGKTAISLEEEPYMVGVEKQAEWYGYFSFILNFLQHELILKKMLCIQNLFIFSVHDQWDTIDFI